MNVGVGVNNKAKFGVEDSETACKVCSWAEMVRAAFVYISFTAFELSIDPLNERINITDPVIMRMATPDHNNIDQVLGSIIFSPY